MSCEATSVLKRYYHHGSIMRDERLRVQFIDTLYDLNDVAFVLENKVRRRRRREEVFLVFPPNALSSGPTGCAVAVAGGQIFRGWRH